MEGGHSGLLLPEFYPYIFYPERRKANVSQHAMGKILLYAGCPKRAS